MKKLFLLILFHYMSAYCLAGHDGLIIFILHIDDSTPNRLAMANVKNESTIAINKISVSKENSLHGIKKETVFTLPVDHVAFWKHYASADLLIAAIGDEGTDFQKILVFDKISPNKPKVFSPRAMTAINVFETVQNDKCLYNFICYDAERKAISIEKIDLSNMRTKTADLSEYIPMATGSRCKIDENGIIELRGFGLDGAKIRHRIPPELASMPSIKNTIWYIRENSQSALILQRHIGSTFELLCMNHKKIWGIYQIPVERPNITRHADKIIVSSTDSAERNTGAHFIVDTGKRTVSAFPLPPLAKILYFDDGVSVVS